MHGMVSVVPHCMAIKEGDDQNHGRQDLIAPLTSK